MQNSIRWISSFMFFLGGCVTASESGSKINGVVYLEHKTTKLDSCEELGTYQGVAASIWGGKIGNSQARVDAIKNAKTDGATHFVETNANWTDGGVSGIGYKCSPNR